LAVVRFRLLLVVDRDSQLRKLLPVNRRRSTCERTDSALRFGEGDALADVLQTQQNGNQSVQAQRDAAVGRWTVTQRIQQETKAILSFIFAESEHFENLHLKGSVAYSNASSAEFDAVDDQVIGSGSHVIGLGVKFFNIFFARGGEWVMGT